RAVACSPDRTTGCRIRLQPRGLPQSQGRTRIESAALAIGRSALRSRNDRKSAPSEKSRSKTGRDQIQTKMALLHNVPIPSQSRTHSESYNKVPSFVGLL